MENSASGKEEKERADAAKAAAEARVAEAQATKSERELKEHDSDLAKAQREAEAQKVTAEANKSVAEARQGQIASLLPDLSKVDRGSLEVKGEQTLFGSELAQRALLAATNSVAKKVGQALGEDQSPRILVTGDAALATSDAVYQDVITGLEQLSSAAAKVIEETEPAHGDQPPRFAAALFAPAAVIGGLSAALPGALSLLSAHRTISGAAATVEGIAATAAAAGSLKALTKATVLHDDIRLLPNGVVRARLSHLDEQRQTLLERKIQLADKKVEAGLIDTILAAIESFTVSLRATAAGATRSPLATAALREQLHAETADGAKDAGKFSHALFVQAAPGSAQQVVSDRPLWFKDKFFAIGLISVAYILIEVGGSEVLAAGSASGKATVGGKIGSEIEVKAETLADSIS
jgi:hypothetical protein